MVKHAEAAGRHSSTAKPESEKNAGFPGLCIAIFRFVYPILGVWYRLISWLRIPMFRVVYPYFRVVYLRYRGR